jgi:hypothetical protein
MKFKFSVIVCCLLTLGCVEVKDQNEKKSKVIQVPQITYKIEPLAQPQAYLVRFSGLNCGLNFRRTSTLKSRVSIDLKNCEDLVNEPGVHRYEWLEGSVPQSLSVNIPEDKIIEGTAQLSQLSPEDVEDHDEIKKQVKISGRLYFRAGSKLVTNGESVLLEANLIHSEGASIVTFESGSRARQITNGLPGGLIFIKAKKVEGLLRVELRGQHGGHGERQGMDVDRVLNGANGGNSGKLWLQVEDPRNSQLSLVKEVGEPGIGSEIIRYGTRPRPRAPRERRVLRRGADGHSGFEERSCLIVNQKCEPLNLN